MKTKPVFAISILSVLALALSACGGAQPGPATPAGVSLQTSVPTQAAEEATPPGQQAATVSLTSTTNGTGSAPGAAIDCLGAAQGDTVSLLYQWSGVEGQKLAPILQPLEDACGIVFRPESSLDPSDLDNRVQAGTPPDVAIWSMVRVQPYAGQLKAMPELGVNASNYPQSWQDQGSIDGRWVALPVKTDIKSIIWYSPASFAAHGYQVPKTFDELNTLVEKMVSDGQVPWSMGFASGPSTGWTGTDWIEDILLVKQGPDFVRGLIDGSRPYNDAAVKEAYQIYGKWATDPRYTVGGAKGTLSIDHHDAIFAVFADPPQAMMVRQSGFSGLLIADRYPNLKFGEDYDFFPFPGIQAVQTGADWMMAFSDRPAVKVLFTYLSSPAGARAWAQATFDVSPNTAAAGAYTDPSLAKRADVLYGSKDTVPDTGDRIPGSFAAAEWKGMVDYVNGGSLDQILADLAVVQKSALAGAGQPAPTGQATP